MHFFITTGGIGVIKKDKLQINFPTSLSWTPTELSWISTASYEYKDETFLLPTTDKVKPEVPTTLDDLGVKWKQATFYKTVISDLSDLADVYYDILVFFSPSGIESLFHNFPDFKQNDTRIAVFGNTTIKAVEAKGLRVDIAAPTPETPSMTMALKKYIEGVNKK